MNKNILVLVFSCSVSLASRGNDLPLTSGNRIVFGGDSIQDGSMCTHYVSAYLILQNPSLILHCQTEARGGLSLEGWLGSTDLNYSHYSRRIFAYEPDFFFMAASVNGAYTKERHKAAMTTLVNDYAVAQGAKVVLYGAIAQSKESGASFCGPFDDAHEEMAAVDPNIRYHKTWFDLKPRFSENRVFTANSNNDLLSSKSHGFADGQAVLFALSNNPPGPTGIFSSIRYYLRDVTADTFKVSSSLGGEPVDILSAGDGTNRVSTTWPLIRREERQDDLHPGQAAHIAYAFKLIVGLGWRTDVSSAEIAAQTLEVVASKHCTISNVAANGFNGIDFTRLDERLPWAIDEEGRRGAEFLYPELRNWQNYTISVSGLAAGTYDVLCDDEIIGSATHVDLASGWNMSDLTRGPVWRQCQEVLGRIRDMHDLSRVYPFGALHSGGERVGVEKYRGAVDNAFKTLGLRGGDLIADSGVQAALHTDPTRSIDHMDDLIHEAAQPVPRLFSIRRSKTPLPPKGVEIVPSNTIED